MTEWLDIVDDQDRVIGRDTRERVHACQHFHRSSHIIVSNSLGQIFVQLRSRLKDTNAGLWDTSAAGHVDSGESYLDCAVRELQEELGLEVEARDLELIGKLEPQSSNGFEFTHVFTVSSDTPLILQSTEIDDGKWLMPAELNEWIERSGEQFTQTFSIVWAMHDQAEA